MKYAVVRNRFDIHDKGILCVFKNAQDRRMNELAARMMYKRKLGIDLMETEFIEIKYQQARKLYNHGIEYHIYSK